MRQPRDKPYAVEPYHDSSFTCDDAGQQSMRAVALRKDRRVKVCFIVMLLSFAGLLLCGFLQFLPGLGVGALVFAGAFLFGAVQLLTGPPRLACSRCGQRMKTAWGPIRDGRDGEYQICPACRIYVFNFRVSR